MDFSNDQIKEFKVEVFLPVSARDSVISAIKNMKMARIGKYYNCISECRVYSSWDADEGASPFLGVAGKSYETEEIKVETRCKKENIEEMISVIKSAHPYENVCINVIPIISFD